MVDFDVVCNDREHYGNGPHAHVNDMLFVPLDGFLNKSHDLGHDGNIAHGRAGGK